MVKPDVSLYIDNKQFKIEKGELSGRLFLITTNSRFISNQFKHILSKNFPNIK